MFYQRSQKPFAFPSSDLVCAQLVGVSGLSRLEHLLRLNFPLASDFVCLGGNQYTKPTTHCHICCWSSSSHSRGIQGLFLSRNFSLLQTVISLYLTMVMRGSIFLSSRTSITSKTTFQFYLARSIYKSTLMRSPPMHWHTFALALAATNRALRCFGEDLTAQM